MQKEGAVSKVYVARVAGAFPAEPTRCDAPLSWSHAEQRAVVDADGGKQALPLLQCRSLGYS